MTAEGYVVRDHEGRELLRTPSERTAAQMVDRLADGEQVDFAVAYRYRTDLHGNGHETPAYWRPGDALR
jgi:hypothetical protein